MKTPNRVLTIALVFLIAMGIFFFESGGDRNEQMVMAQATAKKVRAPELRLFQFNREKSTAYRVKYQEKMTLYVEERQTPPINISLSGLLHFRVFSVRDGRLLAGFQFSGLDIRTDDKSRKRLIDIYSTPFYVSMTTDGVFESFHFKSGKEAYPDLKQLLKYLQIIALNRNGYEREETNLNGRYLSLYHRNERSIHKEKIKYIFLYDESQQIKIIHSNCNAEIDPDGNWLESATIVEESLIERESKPFIKKGSTIKLKKVSSAIDTELAVWSDTPEQEKRNPEIRRQTPSCFLKRTVKQSQ